MATLLSALRLAIVAVWRNKLRAGLTILGILIGVAAVVVTTALGTGARARIAEQIEKLGSNTITVRPQWNQASGARGTRGGPRLSEADMKAILQQSTSVAAAAGFARTDAQVVYEDRNTETHVVGTTKPWFEIRNWPVRTGELWSDTSEISGERVCLLGSTAATDLFGPLDPVGRSLRIGRYPFRVLGVLESKGQAPWGEDQDDFIVMPVSTYRSHVGWVPRKGVHSIILSARSGDTAKHAREQVESILRERHRIADGKQPDFSVRTQEEFRASQDAIYGTLSTLLLVVGAVSLVVGGIGIMNIMLVSVAERTREIGIRLAVGARERNVMLEFLIESVVLALLGGLLGTVFAIAVIYVVASTAGWSMKLEATALLIALGTSMTIGIVFGFVPARRAAKLDPIHALRAE
jgi:putative ABC transport system permease protein